MNKVCSRLFGAGAMLVAATSLSHAATTTTQVNFGPLAVPITTAVNLPTFNAALGTLTGIQLTLSIKYNGNISVFNPTPGSLTLNSASSTTSFTATGPGTTTVGPVSVTSTFTGPVSVAPGTTNFAGTVVTNTSSASVASANFSLYTAPPSAATVGVNITSGTASATGSGDPSLFYSAQGATASGFVQAVYTYTPSGQQTAPEPGALALVGFGTLPFVGMVRRRFTK